MVLNRLNKGMPNKHMDRQLRMEQCFHGTHLHELKTNNWLEKWFNFMINQYSIELDVNYILTRNDCTAVRWGYKRSAVSKVVWLWFCINASDHQKDEGNLFIEQMVKINKNYSSNFVAENIQFSIKLIFLNSKIVLKKCKISWLNQRRRMYFFFTSNHWYSEKNSLIFQHFFYCKSLTTLNMLMLFVCLLWLIWVINENWYRPLDQFQLIYNFGS